MLGVVILTAYFRYNESIDSNLKIDISHGENTFMRRKIDFAPNGVC
jgi:hypothetical protein